MGTSQWLSNCGVPSKPKQTHSWSGGWLVPASSFHHMPPPKQKKTQIQQQQQQQQQQQKSGPPSAGPSNFERISQVP